MELVGGARECTLQPVEIIARGEVVGGDERRAGYRWADALVALEDDRPLSRPRPDLSKAGCAFDLS